MGCGCGGSTKAQTVEQKRAERRGAAPGRRPGVGVTSTPGYYWTGPQTRPKK